MKKDAKQLGMEMDTTLAGKRDYIEHKKLWCTIFHLTFLINGHACFYFLLYFYKCNFHLK
jgi:hypothetical protein